MSRRGGHSVLLITVLKSIFFVYLTVFFVGESTLTNMLTDVGDDYELFEDLEEEDTQEEDTEREANVVRITGYDVRHFANINISRMIASESFGSYKTFHKEIPDPPPEMV